MKIESASIVDPRKHPARGLRPYLTVCVDDLPQTSNDVEKKVFGKGNFQMTSAKYGPFIEFTVNDKNGLSLPLDSEHTLVGQSPAGLFNIVFRDTFAPVVDAVILFEGHSLEGYWALQLRRARTLIKKSRLPWRLILSDHDATRGRVSWAPVSEPLKCMYHGLHSSVACYSRAIDTTVTLNGVDYPLCKTHRELHNKRHAELRTASSHS